MGPDQWATLFEKRKQLGDEHQHLVLTAAIVPDILGVRAERLREIDELIRLLDGQLTATAATTDKSPVLEPQHPIAWKGTGRDFADVILQLQKQNLIQAANETEALRLASEHFVDRDGNKFNAASLLQNLRNRTSEGKSKRRAVLALRSGE